MLQDWLIASTTTPVKMPLQQKEQITAVNISRRYLQSILKQGLHTCRSSGQRPGQFTMPMLKSTFPTPLITISVRPIKHSIPVSPPIFPSTFIRIPRHGILLNPITRRKPISQPSAIDMREIRVRNVSFGSGSLPIRVDCVVLIKYDEDSGLWLR